MTTENLSRRGFLGGAAGLASGLLLGFRWDTAGAAEAGPFAPNAFVQVLPDDTVVVLAKHLEMGQGCYTGLATMLAEELDVAWSHVRVEGAPANAKLYGNINWGGGIQGTGGSSSIAEAHTQMRTAGAQARAMLVSAASKRWGVPAAALSTRDGAVRHKASGRTARYGELVADAAKLPVPKDVPLKDPSAFRLIGKPDLPRVDVAAKTTGKAHFTLDLHAAGGLTAVVARPPRFGGTVKSFDASACKAVKGFERAVQIPRGVAVLARSFWAAKKARDKLKVEWDETGAETRSSEAIFAAYRGLAETPGLPAHAEGDADTALGEAAAVIEATYEFPYLAHAPMEPLDAIIQVKDGVCRLTSGSQIQTLDQGAMAKVFGLPLDKVHADITHAGGSFGRRADPGCEVTLEAATIAKATGITEPIRVVWTREDDLAGGKYRPMSVHRVRLGLAEGGAPSGLHHRIVSQSVIKGSPFEPFMIHDGVDHTSVEGAGEMPYAIPHRKLELHTPDSPVTVLWWRSVGHSTNAYVIETLVDELATAAKVDPLEYRRRLLAPDDRLRGVLEGVAKLARWGRPAPPGRAFGFAMHHSFKSYVAQIAEVSEGPDGLPKVHKVYCAVDCGRAINPDVIAAQMEGGIGFGLGTALYNEITLKDGRVEQANFDSFRSLRVAEMPEVEVHIVPSEAPPTGVGEPGVPPVAAAVANAWFRLTGHRVRTLPFTRWRAEA